MSKTFKKMILIKSV